MREPLLVLGLGNPLCRDDGLGVVVIHRLMYRWEPGPGVRMLEGGTLGLWLLPMLETAETVLLVDAVNAAGKPGTFVRLDGEEVAHAVQHRLSVHQVGVGDLIDAARWQGTLPPHLILLGLVPESVELGLDRTPAVERAIPGLMERVLEECAALGHPLLPREDDGTSGVGVGDGLRRVLGMPCEVR